jgi:transposase
MEVQGYRAGVTCPVCGTPSGRVHSRYARRLGDLPWEGLPVRIVLSTRRFYCVDEGSRHALQGTVAPHPGERPGDRGVHPRERLEAKDEGVGL